ncbi:hypothetical protein SARC_08758 [Sphaeroforma arctica JP610]|uniref:Uncharacterized protein n=1 Tax=Sphaeroforma arctica JP610 TaxID=667725 RepID=A0A0L0FS66_9EUKA|nr:hypothetical protein SARC_08758 [Sphaeroforma arctica JP610]KNC78823.1 hypothetical protein SARC_08758 [Sphaeroforma arctica JP610]|eukprot:XP_014152725.1 hypothetical protein SARC_08758 [Sphaeroforma arctica JP610]
MVNSKLKILRDMSATELESIDPSDVDWHAVFAQTPELHSRQSVGSVQLMWTNHLRPKINTSPFTAAEDNALLSVNLKLKENNQRPDWTAIALQLNTNRTALACFQRYQRSINPSLIRSRWTKEEDARLKELMRLHEHDDNKWSEVAMGMEGRTNQQVMNRWEKSLKPGQSKGRWKAAETEALRKAVEHFGVGDWKNIRTMVPGRSDAQCREHYYNILDPNLPSLRVDWIEEDDLILQALINDLRTPDLVPWSQIAPRLGELSGQPRTDKQCMSRWMTLGSEEALEYRKMRKKQKLLHRGYQTKSSDKSGVKVRHLDAQILKLLVDNREQTALLTDTPGEHSNELTVYDPVTEDTSTDRDRSSTSTTVVSTQTRTPSKDTTNTSNSLVQSATGSARDTDTGMVHTSRGLRPSTYKRRSIYKSRGARGGGKAKKKPKMASRGTQTVQFKVKTAQYTRGHPLGYKKWVVTRELNMLCDLFKLQRTTGRGGSTIYGRESSHTAICRRPSGTDRRGSTCWTGGARGGTISMEDSTRDSLEAAASVRPESTEGVEDGDASARDSAGTSVTLAASSTNTDDQLREELKITTADEVGLGSNTLDNRGTAESSCANDVIGEMGREREDMHMNVVNNTNTAMADTRIDAEEVGDGSAVEKTINATDLTGEEYKITEDNINKKMDKVGTCNRVEKRRPSDADVTGVTTNAKRRRVCAESEGSATDEVAGGAGVHGEGESEPSQAQTQEHTPQQIQTWQQTHEQTRQHAPIIVERQPQAQRLTIAQNQSDVRTQVGPQTQAHPQIQPQANATQDDTQLASDAQGVFSDSLPTEECASAVPIPLLPPNSVTVVAFAHILRQQVSERLVPHQPPMSISRQHMRVQECEIMRNSQDNTREFEDSEPSHTQQPQLQQHQSVVLVSTSQIQNKNKSSTQTHDPAPVQPRASTSLQACAPAAPVATSAVVPTQSQTHTDPLVGHTTGTTTSSHYRLLSERFRAMFMWPALLSTLECEVARGEKAGHSTVSVVDSQEMTQSSVCTQGRTNTSAHTQPDTQSSGSMQGHRTTQSFEHTRIGTVGDVRTQAQELADTRTGTSKCMSNHQSDTELSSNGGGGDDSTTLTFGNGNSQSSMAHDNGLVGIAFPTDAASVGLIASDNTGTDGIDETNHIIGRRKKAAMGNLTRRPITKLRSAKGPKKGSAKVVKGKATISKPGKQVARPNKGSNQNESGDSATALRPTDNSISI